MMYVRTKLKTSSIHGIGLFAAEDIVKGQLIWEFTPGFDFQFSPNQLTKLSKVALKQFLNYSYISKKSGGYILCFDDARFFNHSNTPNVSSISSGKLSVEDICIANRNIKKGEELTCDYTEFDNGPHEVYVKKTELQVEHNN